MLKSSYKPTGWHSANMKSYHKVSVILTVSAFLLLFLPVATTAVAASAYSSPTGAVFTMTNSASGNHIIAYNRLSDGALVRSGSFATRGLGSGVNLGSQGSVILSQDGNWLFVVNAGSNTISEFQVSLNPVKLTFVDKVSSWGIYPISLTMYKDWIYVVNAGNSTTAGNIAGFALSSTSKLVFIPGSVQSLSSSGSVGPAEISFNTWGTQLVVTEKNTNLIDTYMVSGKGVASGPTTNPSQGTEPFGFAFDNSNGALVVSDAASGALTSYNTTSTGTLVLNNGPIVDGGIAPCWVAITGDGRFAYTANAHGNTISSFSVNAKGDLTLLQSVATTTNLTPLDMALGGNSHFLYVVEPGSGDIQAFAIGSIGSLTWIQTAGGLTGTIEGMAAI